MIAAIKLIDPDRRAVFGFAPNAVSQKSEKHWYAALAKSCAGDSCRVGRHDLLEFICLSREKLDRMGVAKGKQPGFWLGVHVREEATWDRIQSGAITKFNLDFDSSGVRIEFPEQFSKKEITRMPESMICKCVSAVQAGDLGHLTKRDFEDALDSIAKSYAAEHGLTFERAYAQILRTDRGAELYRGYDLAPHSPRKVEKHMPADQHAEFLPSWGKIHNRAIELQKEMGRGISIEAAVTKVLESNPELYTDYCRESEALVSQLQKESPTF